MADSLDDITQEEHSVLLTEQEREDKTFTLADVIDRGVMGAFQVNIILFAGLQWIAGAMVIFQLGFLASPVACEWGLSEYQMALSTTSFFLGNIVFGLLYGMISDRYGRKKPFTLAMFLTFYFGIVSALSPNYTWLLVNRFIVGISVLAVASSPAYCVEFIPIRFRASSVLLLQLFWGVGGCLDALIAYLTLNELGWRYFISICTLPAILVFFYSLLMPESPRYLLAKGDNQRSEQVIRHMAKMNCTRLPAGHLVEDTSSVAVSYRKQGDSEAEAAINIRKTQKKEENLISTLSILFGKRYLFTTIIINLIWFISWFVYYGIILLTMDILHRDYCGQYNSMNPEPKEDIPRGCQYFSDSDYLDTFITYISEFPGVFLNIVLTECLGRKSALFIEFILTGLGFMLLLICSLAHSRVAKTILIFVVRAALTSSIQVSYVIASEVYPTRARVTGLSLCTMVGSLGALITPFIAQVLLKSSYEATLVVYGGLSVLGAILSIFLTETKGKILK